MLMATEGVPGGENRADMGAPHRFAAQVPTNHSHVAFPRPGYDYHLARPEMRPHHPSRAREIGSFCPQARKPRGPGICHAPAWTVPRLEDQSIIISQELILEMGTPLILRINVRWAMLAARPGRIRCLAFPSDDRSHGSRSPVSLSYI